MHEKSETQKSILAAGKEEFLKKGFKDASLREIATAAGVTTGAIYGYYSDKNALFSALVEPVASLFLERFETIQDTFAALPEKEQIASMNVYSTGELMLMLDYIYENFDVFRLILCCSDGTKFENYIHHLVEVEATSTVKFIALLKRNGFTPTDISENLAHILANAYFSAIFETVVHNMNQTEAHHYVEHLTAFFTAGWDKLLGLVQK